jgi:hypothetical protein
MVTGYLFVMRAHRQDALTAAQATEPSVRPAVPRRAVVQNDIAIRMSGEPVESVVRFHNAIRELAGRRGIRNDVSRYESAALALVDPAAAELGEVLPSYPTAESPLRLERFFETLYLRYDERYVYSAPDLKTVTRRREWLADSPGLMVPPQGLALDYEPRLAVSGAEDP